MPSTLLRLAFWAALAFAFVMAVLPQPPSMPISSDKLLHMIAFAVLAGLAAVAWPRTPLLRIGLWLAGFGALIEIVQMIPALNRYPSLADWIADLVAIAAVLALAALFRRRRRRSGRLDVRRQFK